MSLVQPLGKNFFGLADRATIKLTKKDIENTEYTSFDNIERALYNVQVAYWKYVLRCEELVITEDIYKEAVWLYDLYQDKLKTGLIEKGDLLAAEANMRARESNVLLAKLGKETARNDLLFLLNVYDLDTELIPLDSLMVDAYTIDLDKIMKKAVESRRDYKRIKNSIDANKIDIVVKKNALWPEIDLEASFTRNGLDRKYQEAWREISTQDNREVFVGVSLTIPFENNSAKADLKEATLQKEQLLLSLKQTERLILKDVHNSVSTVNIFKEQVNNAAKVASLQEDKLEEEFKRLKQGRSNSDFIIRYTEDVLHSQIAFAQSLYKYRVSLIDVDLAANTLLDKYWQDVL